MATVGQYGAETLIDASSGRPLPAATPINVYESDGVTLATIYTSSAGSVIAANPTSLDGFGNLTFFAVPGYYEIAPILNGTQSNLVSVYIAQAGSNSLDSTVGDIAAAGATPAVGSTGLAADAGHVHGLALVNAWVANTNYAQGRLVTHSGGLYQAPNGGISGNASFQAGWVELATVGGGTGLSLSAQLPSSSPYHAGNGDVVFASGATCPSVILPAVSAGDVIWAKKTDSGGTAVTVTATGGVNIDGVSSFVLSLQYDAAMFVCDGTTWGVF